MDRAARGFGPSEPSGPSSDSRYIAFVMITLDHHAQLNRSICILVYTSTLRIPYPTRLQPLLYYLALHYLLTRGCDHLTGRCRDKRLLNLLCDTLKKKGEAFIIFNRLDECGQWPELLYCIKILKRKSGRRNLHLLLNNRRNVTIKQGLKQLGPAKLSINEIYSIFAIGKFVKT